MTADEKARQIANGERARCMVPFCKRTFPVPIEHRGRNHEFLCGTHWRTARKLYRTAHVRYMKKRGTNWSPFWRRIVDEAVAKSGMEL